MRNDEKFLELLQSLENDRYLFQNGILHSQKEFIDNIHRLRSFIPQICNDKIRDKVEKFHIMFLNSCSLRVEILHHF